MQQVHPIDATVVCYGPASAVSKIRTVFTKMLAEDDPSLSKQDLAALAEELSASQARDAIDAQRFDTATPLPTATASKKGLRLRLPGLTERLLTLELLDLAFAKSATCLLWWESRNDEQTHQVLWSDGAVQQAER